MKLPDFTPEFRLLLASAQSPMQLGEHERLQAACRAVTQWSPFLALTDRHQVAAIIYRSLSQHAAAQVPVEILEQLRTRAERIRRQALALTREQNLIAGWLAAEGLNLCSLKGPLLSQRLYGDISWRATGDLDVLVPSTNLAGAERLLLAHGYERTQPRVALSPQQQQFYGRLFHHLEYIHRERHISVELHYLIAEPYLIPPTITTQMLARAESQTLAGTRILTFTAEDTLAYLLIHGARHNWARLKWVIDIAALIRQAEGLDWASVRQLLTEVGWFRAFGQGLLLANQLLGCPLPAQAQEVIMSAPTIHRLAESCVQALLAPQDYTSTPGPWHGLRHLLFLMQLNPNPRHVLALLTTVQLDYKRWKQVSRLIGRSPN